MSLLIVVVNISKQTLIDAQTAYSNRVSQFRAMLEEDIEDIRCAGACTRSCNERECILKNQIEKIHTTHRKLMIMAPKTSRKEGVKYTERENRCGMNGKCMREQRSNRSTVL